MCVHSLRPRKADLTWVLIECWAGPPVAQAAGDGRLGSGATKARPERACGGDGAGTTGFPVRLHRLERQGLVEVPVSA